MSELFGAPWRALVAGAASAALVVSLAPPGHTAPPAGTATPGGTARAADEPAAKPAGKPVLRPRSRFVMQADGSSGLRRNGAGIPNIDSVKATIRRYYRATDGIADKNRSPYVRELAQLQRKALADLPPVDPAARRAVVLDADDTTLWTYDMEDAAMQFVFDPDLQDEWVQDQRFPATPGMVAFVDAVEERGYTVFGLTGRNDDQKAATLGNLADVGYDDFTAERFFTKWTGEGGSQQPEYITCATAKCTTVEYKAGTRRHIEEDLGYDVALSVGDQWSDLQGGYADDVLKLPNPTYYLPSPNLPGVEEPALAPRTRFTMRPNGSSGATESGERIPNIDSVKATIRAYYGATDGIADRASSRYVEEMRALVDRILPQVRDRCATLSERRKRPAIVLDADDTTLWTYDMEDAAMQFVFDPALQDEWVQDQRFPATPAMRRLVRVADRHGCTVIGLTGRDDDQKAATLGNLNTLYGGVFRSRLYFTKWTGEGDSQQPDYLHCATDECTRVEYKAGTRRHLERDLGYRIAFNVGDQFSDLQGPGHADRSIKLPNPTYYLP